MLFHFFDTLFAAEDRATTLSHAAEGPDFEVWNHLESGWQMAHDDMSRKLGRDSMRILEALAEAIVGLRTDLVVRSPSGHMLKPFRLEDLL